MRLSFVLLLVWVSGCNAQPLCAPATTNKGALVQAIVREAFNTCPPDPDGSGTEDPDALGGGTIDAGPSPTGCASPPIDPCSQCIAACALSTGNNNCEGSPSSATLSCAADSCASSCQGP